ncbi:MAG TPA: hypothetical protein PKG71_00175 [Candidatus Woesebacteria bacterium]|nr:hypothetical protein [Candidatus Woesebacteria bacterium]HNS94373.1 hypothetical protein [Candidatus Woesebacteria bacterium]
MSQKLLSIIIVVLVGLLLYTRFVNLDWGLPYPMHPDERNMADALMRLDCKDPEAFFVGYFTDGPSNALRLLLEGRHSVSPSKVSCLNPEFFAYGQLSLYLGFGLAHGFHGLRVLLGEALAGSSLTFWDAVMGLRIISAVASCFTLVVVMRILSVLHPSFKRFEFRIVAFLSLVFSPVLIQSAHFGTTESLLMLWYALLVHRALIALARPHILRSDVLIMGSIVGLAVATKTSSLLFLLIPGVVIFVKVLAGAWAEIQSMCSVSKNTQSDALLASTTPSSSLGTGHTEGEVKKQSTHTILAYGWVFAVARTWLQMVVVLVAYAVYLVLVSGVIAYVYSPHNLISLQELLSSMQYEGDVALGRYVAFYTRQFLYELPLLFHGEHVFAYALGPVVSLLALSGFIMLPYRQGSNVIRLSILLLFAFTMGWYAKWTRFLAPTYPLLIAMALLALAHAYEQINTHAANKPIPPIKMKVLGVLFAVSMILPGMAFLTVYTSRDVRFVASDWVYQNVKPGSIVLSETANVIDVPVPDVAGKKRAPDAFSIQYISFNFYDVDSNPALQTQLQKHIADADYIFVPSRRVYYNHTCVGLDGMHTNTRHSERKCELLNESYPVLTKYYEDLFSGKLGFEKVAEFTSYPRIELLGQTIVSFPNEEAEETFTVFDHPVMRIYKRAEKP